MIVTPEAPVNAVKNAHAAVQTNAKPPGIQPNIAPVNRTNRFGALLSLNKYPAKVKSGIAARNGMLAILCISIAMIIKSESCP